MTALPSTAPGGARARRSADSRALILEAAVACLVEDGSAGAATLAVQARAGVSRGRLLHHFPSRAELLVAAAQYLATSSLAALQERAPALMGGPAPGPARDGAEGRRPAAPGAGAPVDRLDVGDVPRAAVLGRARALDGGPHRPRAAQG